MIKRYKNRVIGCPECGTPKDDLREHPEGDWVEYEFYAALEARCREAQAYHLATVQIEAGLNKRIAELEAVINEPITVRIYKDNDVIVDAAALAKKCAMRILPFERSSKETPVKPLEYGRCINWPCELPHGHIGPCTTPKQR